MFLSPRIAAMALIAALIASCAQSGPEYPGPGAAPDASAVGTPSASLPATDYPGPATSAPREQAAFEDLDWVLTGSGDPTALTAPPDAVSVTARFDSGTQTVGGSSGCNSYSAEYRRAGQSSIQFEAARSTLMACEDALMQVETDYLTHLAAVIAWELTAEKLTLTTADGSVLVFVPSEETSS